MLAGSLQMVTVTSDPSGDGPSAISQTVNHRTRLPRPPRPCSRSRCGLSATSITRVHPHARVLEPKASRGADADRIDAGKAVVGDEVVRERGAHREVHEQVENTLSRNVDRSGCGHGAHAAAILTRRSLLPSSQFPSNFRLFGPTGPIAVVKIITSGEVAMTMTSEPSAEAEIHHSGEQITIARPGALYCVELWIRGLDRDPRLAPRVSGVRRRELPPQRLDL